MRNPFRHSLEIARTNQSGFHELLKSLLSVIPASIGHILDTLYSQDLYSRQGKGGTLSHLLAIPFEYVGWGVGFVVHNILLIPAVIGYSVDSAVDWLLGKERSADPVQLPLHRHLKSVLYRGFFGKFLGFLPAFLETVVCTVLSVPAIIVNILATAIADSVDGLRQILVQKKHKELLKAFKEVYELDYEYVQVGSADKVDREIDDTNLGIEEGRRFEIHQTKADFLDSVSRITQESTLEAAFRVTFYTDWQPLVRDSSLTYNNQSEFLLTLSSINAALQGHFTPQLREAFKGPRLLSESSVPEIKYVRLDGPDKRIFDVESIKDILKTGNIDTRRDFECFDHNLRPFIVIQPDQKFISLSNEELRTLLDEQRLPETLSKALRVTRELDERSVSAIAQIEVNGQKYAKRGWESLSSKLDCPFVEAKLYDQQGNLIVKGEMESFNITAKSIQSLANGLLLPDQLIEAAKGKNPLGTVTHIYVQEVDVILTATTTTTVRAQWLKREDFSNGVGSSTYGNSHFAVTLYDENGRIVREMRSNVDGIKMALAPTNANLGTNPEALGAAILPSSNTTTAPPPVIPESGLEIPPPLPR